MITIPECFHCIHYNNGKCPAYPEGIPYKILAENKAGNPEWQNNAIRDFFVFRRFLIVFIRSCFRWCAVVD